MEKQVAYNFVSRKSYFLVPLIWLVIACSPSTDKSETVPLYRIQYGEIVDPIDDSVTRTIRIVGKSTTDQSFVYYAPYLTILCTPQHDVTLSIGWPYPIGSLFSEKEMTVLTRIDSQPAEERKWLYVSDFQTDYGDAVKLLNEMLSAKTLTLRTRNNDKTQTVVFDTSRLSAAIVPIKKNCNWKTLAQKNADT